MYIEDNISFLTNNKYNWVAPITEDLEPIFKGSEPNGNTYFQYSSGEYIVLKDKLDKDYKSRVTHKEILVVFGVFSVNEISKLYQTKNKDTLIIIIEPNLTVFNYVLNNKNLKIFSQPNIVLFADNSPENIITFLQPIIFDISYVQLLKKVNFYFTDYYRTNDLKLIKQYIQLIRQTILGTVRAFGNDIVDSLIGLERNLKNLPYILTAKDTAQMKDLHKGKPAIIVAAGPSLNKNFHLLKSVKDKAVIVAVDTIVKRLLDEGIIPDFVCSIERSERTYEFFYQENNIPKEVTFVAPAVIETRILEEYKGNILLPFRNEISETMWLQRIMNLPKESGIYMGSSCAHVAFGIAEHLGCSPLILVGQDLAFSDDSVTTHAEGTIYHKLNRAPISKSRHDTVEGYFGGTVTTTDTWRQFKVWFEKRIGEANLHVIDATEGGARIYFTERKSLQETIAKYCEKDVPHTSTLLSNIKSYPIDKNQLRNNLQTEVDYCEALLKNIIIYFKKVENMEIDYNNFTKYYDELTVIHYIIKDVWDNDLLLHNLQSSILKYLWALNSREQIINKENVQNEKEEQIKLLGIMSRTIYEVQVNIKAALYEINKE